MTGIQSHKIETEADEHVFVMVEQALRPTVSIDITNKHGRRTMSVRLDGMTTFSMLVDSEHLEPHGEAIQRFCPYCGDERNLVASVDRHVCPPEGERSRVKYDHPVLDANVLERARAALGPKVALAHKLPLMKADEIVGDVLSYMGYGSVRLIDTPERRSLVGPLLESPGAI